MSYSIISSKTTGNTGMLAETVEKGLAQFSNDECIFCGSTADITPDALSAKRFYIGFWTDQGMCDQNTKAILSKLKDKEIFLFGSAGFGLTEQYFNDVLCKTKEFIDSSNKIIGEFMCQGKMKPAIRDKYVAMLQQATEKNDEKTIKTANMLIGNFDLAKSHPDANDLSNLINKLESIK